MPTNAVFQKVGAEKVFRAVGGDVLFTPKAKASGVGRVSTRCDLGAFPHPMQFRWYAETQAQATPTVGRTLRLYLAFWSDDAGPGRPDGGVPAADADLTVENDLLNLQALGQVVVDTAAADTVFQKSGTVWIPTRYVSVVWWNDTGASLTADDAEHLFVLAPIFDDIQAAA